MLSRWTTALLLAMSFGLVTSAAAGNKNGTSVVYDSIPNPLPGNVASEGPEAYAFSELGDGFYLSPPDASGTLGQVKVILSSWACQSGRWYTGDCVTTPGATFSQPLTINVYSVSYAYSSVYGGTVPTPGSLLGTTTQTFTLPYRPSSTPSLCNGDTGAWYDSKDKTCYHGISASVTVNLSGDHISLPANGQLMVTVAFNSTHYGPNPIGESAPCYSTSAGCPYDSLNIATDTTDGNFYLVGSPVAPNGIFVNYTYDSNACPGNTVTGVLALDQSTDGSPCWVGYHPEIQVLANTNTTHHSKANNP